MWKRLHIPQNLVKIPGYNSFESSIKFSFSKGWRKALRIRILIFPRCSYQTNSCLQILAAVIKHVYIIGNNMKIACLTNTHSHGFDKFSFIEGFWIVWLKIKRAENLSWFRCNLIVMMSGIRAAWLPTAANLVLLGMGPTTLINRFV